ncbi:MAG: hypothetical protein LQ351_000936 [Letrouitia transgressa]|nr:MAG: hypothetical protein LQ351_000936 [Letrouitia transgressa]
MNSTPSLMVPPNSAEYGGDENLSDEISALVLDPGYSVTRAGFAGEDVPKSVVPSYYATVPSASGPRNLFDENAIYTPLPGISIANPMSKDGIVEDWEMATKLWEYSITSRLTNTKQGHPLTNGLNDNNDELKQEMEGVETQEKILEENPLLMTEPGWNAGKGREKPLEIALEDWGAPAFFLGRSGVLSAFSAGKPSALVVDVGAANVSITPVHDGLILKRGIFRSPIAGNYISDQLRLIFSTAQTPVNLVPHYLVASKTPVDAGAPAQATYRTWQPGTEPTPSFRALQEERVLSEFKECAAAVWTAGRLGGHNPQGGTNLDLARSQPPRSFEMPDGYNQMFSDDRYRAAEALFDAKMALSNGTVAAPMQHETIPALVQQSLAQVDVDIRPLLLGNIVVVGGSSLLYGFNERLKLELEQLYPGPRVRIYSAGNTVERKYSSWIGGSILASLGTFHQVGWLFTLFLLSSLSPKWMKLLMLGVGKPQMWISKKEYDEHGPAIVEKRCK